MTENKMKGYSSGSIGRGSFVLLLLLSTLMSAPYVQCLGDDTFIVMRAINHFLDSGRLEYNAGEPCYVMTSPTWFLAWSGATAVLKDLDIARYILSILSHVYSFIIIYFLARRVIRNQFVIFLVLATIFLDPFYLRWIFSGLEIGLKIATAATTILFLLSLRSHSSHRVYFLAGLCAGFSVLTRPEMILLAALGFVYLIVKFSNSISKVSFYALGLLIIISPWLTYTHLVFGSVVPHTVFAKTGYYGLSLSYLTTTVSTLAKIVFIPMSVLILTAVIAYYKKFTKSHTSQRMPDKTSESLLNEGNNLRAIDYILLAIWAFSIFGYTIAGANVSSAKTVLYSPFIAILVGCFVDSLFRSASDPWMNRVKLASLSLAIVIISVAIQTKLYYKYSIFNPRFRQGTDQNYIEFALRTKELSSPDDIIGLWELGVVGYYTDRYIVDFAGIATPEILEYRSKCKCPDHDYQCYCPNGYVSQFLRNSGKVPKFIVALYYDPEDSSYRSFFGHEYYPIHWRKIKRISGKDSARESQPYVLYKRRG